MLATDYEMALRNEDKAWIGAEINKAVADIESKINTLRPRGWRRALTLLREWSVLGVAASIIVTLFIFAMTQWSAANSRLAVEAGFRERTDERLKRIENDINSMRALIASTEPQRAANQEIAKRAVQLARVGDASLSRDVVQTVGRRFLEVADKNSGAWDVALNFLSYASKLNAAPYASSEKRSPEKLHLHFNVSEVPGIPKPQLFMAGDQVPRSEAARMDLIGRDLNEDHALGIQALIASGGAVSLDGYHFRNVTFQNVRVRYSGGPLIMENVTFVDCTFVMDNKPPTRKLSESLLATSAVSYANVPAGG